MQISHTSVFLFHHFGKNDPSFIFHSHYRTSHYQLITAISRTKLAEPGIDSEQEEDKDNAFGYYCCA